MSLLRGACPTSGDPGGHGGSEDEVDDGEQSVDDEENKEGAYTTRRGRMAVIVGGIRPCRMEASGR